MTQVPYCGLAASGVCSRRPHSSSSNAEQREGGAVAGPPAISPTEEQLIEEGVSGDGVVEAWTAMEPMFLPMLTRRREEKVETNTEAANVDKTQGVKMELSVLDCLVCYEPLSPPILQCGVGHVLCSICRAQLTKCPLCLGTVFQRCFAMERVVESVVVPCCFAKDGCAKEISYLNKKKHEKGCRYGPCFCPESGCGFIGPTPSLLNHFTTHKWPSTPFKYNKQFDLVVQPGPHMLHAQNEDGRLFIVNMEPVEPVGHTISIVCPHPNVCQSYYRCSVVFSWFTGHHQISTLEYVSCSSLSDGLPKDFFCIVPNASGEVVLRTTIETLELIDVDDEGEEDDEDESYDEDEDGTDQSQQTDDSDDE